MSKTSNGSSIQIRDATPADVPAITAIYRPAVTDGTASFELEPPDEVEMRRRFDTVVGGGFPYLVAVVDGEVQGYAYVSQYRARPAYRFSVENSIYVAPSAHRGGIGRVLLSALIERCTAKGYRQMIAVIGDGTQQKGSVALHTALGFRMIGTIKSIGWKHGRWLDSVSMQLPLGPGDTTAPDR